MGRKILAEHPSTTGSLGCAISEAVEVATSKEGYRYVLGSVLNQVVLHQSIIGLETKIAMDKYGIRPDVIIGCAGGGSNLGGLISPFMGEKLRGEADYQFIAVEPASCPSLTRGVYAYDFCDTGMVCPLAKMYTLGSGFIPSPNHAGGLRYHGMSPVLSQLYHDGYMEARSVEQTAVFAAAEQFARVEGILPAPESSHAIKVAIDEAMKCKETGEEKTILFRPHRNRLLRHGGLREIPQRADDRLHPLRRGPAGWLCRTAEGAGGAVETALSPADRRDSNAPERQTQKALRGIYEIIEKNFYTAASFFSPSRISLSTSREKPSTLRVCSFVTPSTLPMSTILARYSFSSENFGSTRTPVSFWM